jgi:hypothetical protein
VRHETVLANNIAEIMITSNGEMPGVLGVENGETIQAVDAQTLKEIVKKCIRYQRPFECNDWDVLCSAVIDEYNPNWGSSLVWVLGCIRKLKAIETLGGSWNVPLMWVTYPQEERTTFKVFRDFSKRPEFADKGYTQLSYEFHQDWVPANKWIKAEVSSSAGLSGIKKEEDGGIGGQFHMLLDKYQAEAYLESRVKYTNWFIKEEAVIQPVKGRQFLTIDLVYSPPKTFV